MSTASWIDNEAVLHALTHDDDSKLVSSGVPFSISEDRIYCVLVREHDAWLVPSGGWREANRPPEPGERGRFVLNFYKVQFGVGFGLWFKTLVPMREGRPNITSAGVGGCTIHGDATELHLKFEGIDRLMFRLMTGHAQPEQAIEDAYALIGAS